MKVTSERREQRAEAAEECERKQNERMQKKQKQKNVKKENGKKTVDSKKLFPYGFESKISPNQGLKTNMVINT